VAARINASRLKRLEVVGGRLAKAAKALVVSELIAIFHPGDGKS
jgi:hypothetical protein